MNAAERNRYLGLKKILLSQRRFLSMSAVARELGCTPSLISGFFLGRTNSLRVARGLAALTNSHAAVRRICRLTIEELPDPVIINNESATPACSASGPIPVPAPLDRPGSVTLHPFNNDGVAADPPADPPASAPVEASVTLDPLVSETDLPAPMIANCKPGDRDGQ